MVQPPITLRRAGTRDTAEAARVLRASVRALCAEDHGGDEALIGLWCARLTLAVVGGFLASGLPRLWLAERGRRVLGVGAFLPTGEIMALHVVPAARFQGVSTLLLARIEADLRAAGEEVAAVASPRTAVRFFIARGWQEAGAPVDRHGLPAQPMVRRLGPAGPGVPDRGGVSPAGGGR